ncbi:POLAR LOCALIZATION DURING ASYMMETRIC DIVISION AND REDISTRIBUTION [Spatholobus suberectus]|nr:POLAR LOCALIZATION DURING ASYMMETRIC DIVISION AND REDISTRIBUTION [Spatholobus suberectus]
MCMMAGKAEINELTKTMDKTAKVVEELKSELIIRKSSRAHQVLDYVGNIGMECCKMTVRDDEIVLKKTRSELRDTDVKFWSLPLIDNGECESSSLTEESDPLVLEMDQVEAELEFELQKLPRHTIDSNCHDEMRPKLDEVKVPNEGYDGSDDLNFNSSQYHGVSPSELNQKLCQLLIEQQENQIVELESKLNLAQSKLQEKEDELQALKNCVTLLTELPISTVSGMIKYHETEAHKGTTDWDYNTEDSESKQSDDGVKTPIDSEPCAYYPEK